MMDSQVGNNNLLQNQSLSSKATSTPVFTARPVGFYKLVILNVLTLLSALLLGYSYRVFFDGATSLWWVMGALTFFGICSSFELFLNTNHFRRAAVIALEIIGFLAFFYDEPLRLLGSVAAILVIFFAWGEVDGRRSVQAFINVKFMWASKLQLKKVMTALVLAGIILFLPTFEEKSDVIRPAGFHRVFSMGATIAKSIYPNVNFEGTFEEFSQSFVRTQLSANPQFTSLPEDQKVKVVDVKVGEFTDTMNKNLGIRIDPSKISSDVFYTSLEATFESWRKQYGGNFTAAWAITLFLLAQSFGLLFYSLIAFSAYIVYELLLAGGVIQVLGETQTRETVLFK